MKSDKNIEDVHWSFWLIGIIALVWNVLGSINFLMQLSPDSLANYSEAARSLVEERPAWATGAFAVAVFGGMVGCLLLLIKQSAAYYLFIASLLGVLVTNIHTFSTTNSKEIWIGSLMSVLVAVLLTWYSKRAERKGWIN